MRRIGLAALLVLLLAGCKPNPLPQEGRIWYIEKDDRGVWVSCWLDIQPQISAMACEPIDVGP